MLTPEDLQAFMEQHNIPGEILFLEQPTLTVNDAARALGVAPEQIVKSVLFTIKDLRVLAMTSGTQLIDQRALAARFGVGRKRVRLAPPPVVLEATGYPVGSVPPFGHATPLTLLIDPGVLEHEVVYAGGGAHNAMLRISPAEIVRVTQAETLPLHQTTA